MAAAQGVWQSFLGQCYSLEMAGLKRTVALVGMMGAGKSTVGRRLAERLGVTFRDADAEIEIAAGCAISEIFDRFGEPAFREGERRVISRLLKAPAHVLSTGGGAFMDPITREAMKESAISVWIRAPLSILEERVLRRKNRPLLREGNLRETLRRLLEERTPVYELADVHVDSDDGPHQFAVDRIVAELQARGLIEAP